MFIGDRAFKGCVGLTQIRIPESVTDIGEDVFDGCENTVYVFGTAGSAAEHYYDGKDGLVFVKVGE